ncbi:nucleophile aminohydrolase [Elsinoe ampelina]|uniref:Nucleophile aminohydrolase n=1 Tax=Elsinoe ampelina TaxID=302913 RepID=A0A6A6GDN9_9PEZI|nr:nucleophile aminohydrolase [Elsinoe ampelina]
MSSPTPTKTPIKPRIIIHGGAGAITPANLPPALYAAHRAALLGIVSSTASLLSDPSTTALDAAVHAVTLLELNPLYNAGRGGVFTTAGRIEHESSVMLSTPHPVAGTTMRTSRVKHPILLAKSMLLRASSPDGGGAQTHVQLCGETAERLAVEWGLEMVRPSWHWSRKRWEQHRRGGSREAVEDCGYAEALKKGGWNGTDYLPQGTVGAVVLDRYGTICAATSTGGMTNKLPGRIGDTPTIGAGFWAESWEGSGAVAFVTQDRTVSPLEKILRGDWTDVLRDWLPEWMLPSPTATYLPVSTTDVDSKNQSRLTRAVGMSGTGNGDSFLQVCCVRTVAALARFSSPSPSLQTAVSKMAGLGGLLQESAGHRWGKTGEGEGGIIGIELVDGVGNVVSDFNCGGMFRAWIDDEEKGKMMVFKEEYHDV